MHREHERLHLRHARAQPLDDVEPGAALEREIDEGDVGRVGSDRGERFAGFFGLADDDEVVLGLDQHLQPVAHQRVIVDEEDARGRHRAHGRSCWIGTVHSTRVPPVGAVSIASVASM